MKNREQCDSCWAFSTTSSFKGDRFLAGFAHQVTADENDGFEAFKAYAERCKGQAHVEYIATAPDVFYAAPALEVKYLAPVPLAYAAPVAAETVGFSSFPVEPDDLDAKIKFLVAETLSGVGSLVSTHTETVCQ